MRTAVRINPYYSTFTQGFRRGEELVMFAGLEDAELERLEQFVRELGINGETPIDFVELNSVPHWQPGLIVARTVMGERFRNARAAAESWWERLGLDMFSPENVAGFLAGAKQVLDATAD